MPREKNTAARILVPLVAISLGALIAIGVFRGSAPSATPTPAQNTPADAQQADAPETSLVDAPANTDADAAKPEGAVEDVQQPAEDVADEFEAPSIGAVGEDALSGLRPMLAPPADGGLTPIGALDGVNGYSAQVEFTPLGAGVQSITLADYYTTIAKEDRYAVQTPATVGQYTVASLAARSIVISGQTVDLYASGVADAWIWREVAPGSFEATVVNDAGDPVVRITKQYTIAPGSFEIRVEQRVANLTDRALDIRWVQYGPVDLPEDQTLYGGDKRRLAFGHLLSQQRDPSRQIVDATDFIPRMTAIDKPQDPSGLLWPTPKAAREGADQLVWAAMTNRYFVFAVHSLLDDGVVSSGQPVDKRFRAAERVYARALVDNSTGQSTLLLELQSAPLNVAPGSEVNLDIGAYAGPLWRKTLGQDASQKSLGLDQLIIFNFGGMCAFCTFQPLARLLLWVLGTAHDYLVFDWALAIMLLVVIVRGILHPVTKKSQISLQRFTKQMQAIAPKQKALQEKFKNDPKRLQQEMARLMREEGVNFTGALGCLPMFLQSPIWIALYAMLYFAFDLRHEQAFFGLFQTVTGGAWPFLSDLSAPDRFIPLGINLSIPLVGNVTSLNILPLLLGVVFYLQQKYLTPPPSAAMTPEQQTQQKIMKIMMVVMFPLIMYNAPSGLSIYFITNSCLGIAESRYIRAHIDQMDLNPPKPGEQKRRKVRNQAKNPFSKDRDGASKYKPRKKKR